jgi:hypothetical protein
MRILQSAVALACMQLQAGAQVRPSQADLDYVLGQTVAECLISKCSIFRGPLLTDSPKSGQTVVVGVDEWMFGPARETAVRVHYSSEIFPKAALDSPGYAWRGVSLVRGTPLTVILALEQIRATPPGNPMFVTSDNPTSDLIRSVAADVVRLGRDPAEVSEAVSSLSRDPRPSMAGALYVYLTEQVGLGNPALSTRLLGQMIGSPSVPPQTWNLYSGAIVVNFHNLSVGERAVVIERFAELSQHPDARAAAAALYGLAAISEFDGSVGSMIPATAFRKVIASYQSVVASGAFSRNESLERALGIVR